MKRNIKAICLALLALAGMSSCSDWTDTEIKDPTDLTTTNRDAAYYQRLKAYKASDHAVAFGWFGNWTGNGAKLENCLMGLPDSVDFVSIWGNFKNISQDQKDDLRQVQQLKGTKALICFIVMDIGDQITPEMPQSEVDKGTTWDEWRHQSKKRKASRDSGAMDNIGASVHALRNHDGTGRKIIVDTYGGYARHGGGAFSGKDPTKVDRSATYAARHAAKNVVAAGLADRCEIQLAYAIGIAEPVSIMVDTFGTGKLPDEEIADIVSRHFELTPAAIIKNLDLRRPIYRQTAAYGHFGRTDVKLPRDVRSRTSSASRTTRSKPTSMSAR